VVHYLKTHKKMREDLRWGHQDYFSKYLVARCWPKMYQRINSWSSRGYIFVLGRISRNDLEDQVSARFDEISAAFADRNNRELAMTVAGMVRDGEMESVIMRLSGRSEWDLTPLITSLGGLKQDAPQHKDSGTYDVTTCFDFHQLLIATLLAYGTALRTISTHKGKGTKGLVEKCRDARVCGNLLSKIASSRMLRQHLTGCLKFLYVPTYDQRLAYNDYMKSPMEDSDSSANPENLGSAVEDIDLKGSETLDEVFLKWVRLQASYWLDLSLLSRTFGSSNPAYPVPEVALVAVKHPIHNIDPCSVEPLETTLKDLIGSDPDHPININEVLAVIKEKGGKEHVYLGSIHCEVALAVLILLARNSSTAVIKKLGVITGVLQVLFTRIIIMLINLTSCAERERRHYYGVKAMLPSLLGDHGHLQRRDQAIQHPWPPSYPFPDRVPRISVSAGIVRNDHSLQRILI
jgi:hypothetical protein